MSSKETVLDNLGTNKDIKVPGVIEEMDSALEAQYSNILKKNTDLNRSIVSFQANKKNSFHRWYKYKEAFSSDLIKYLFNKYQPSGKIIDPFAGIGTTLFTSAEFGLNSEGIELLPIGQFIISARKTIEYDLKPKDVNQIKKWVEEKPWKTFKSDYQLNELRITKGAYPKKTKESIERYISFSNSLSKPLKEVSIFALLCVLESISYTRKDGQYLRWDYRSGRRVGENTFNKGAILEFDEAITKKLSDIFEDKTGHGEQKSLFENSNHKNSSRGNILLHKGSCLSILPELQSESYSFAITSPPYCNRYDYTRTYALELALLGFNESQVINLRQEMLSCTVENREKDLLTFSHSWAFPIKICETNNLISSIVSYLYELKELGELNNNGIPRMIKGYFLEMACVIYELNRILEPGGRFVMVNDNVKYAGVPISVDLILSNFAEQCGFCIEEIMVLPSGKGNSSQQMGTHGRSPLRKCVYIWRKI